MEIKIGRKPSPRYFSYRSQSKSSFVVSNSSDLAAEMALSSTGMLNEAESESEMEQKNSWTGCDLQPRRA